MPVLITEMPPNRSLKELLDMKRNYEDIKEWDDTKKLINIYGIASGMSYLHSCDIIHRNLSPESIYLDEHLFPKIGNFGLLIEIHSKESMTFQTTIGIKGNLLYSSPEILEENIYSKSSDVYAFGFIVYEIMTQKIPFKKIRNSDKLFNEVVIKENLPKIKSNVPEKYRLLIEKCWAQNPEERPSFDHICSILKSDLGFITDDVNKEVFQQYVRFIEESDVQFYYNDKSIDMNEKILGLSEFINDKKNIIIENNEDTDAEKIKKETEDDALITKEKRNDQNVKKTDKNDISTETPNNQISCDILKEQIKDETLKDPDVKKITENEINEKLPTEEKTDAEINEKLVNKSLIDADVNENENIDLIKEFAKKYSIENDSENTYLYMSKLIHLGEFDVPMEYGIRLYKQGEFKVSMNYFKLLSKYNHPIANFFIGIMKYKGEGCNSDRTESYSILKHLSDNGIDKATEFIKDNF